MFHSILFPFQNIPDDLREVREILQGNDPYVQKVGEQYNNNKGDGQQRHSSRSRKHSSLDEFDLDLTGLKETMGKITVPNTYPELFQGRKMGLFADKGNG